MGIGHAVCPVAGELKVRLLVEPLRQAGVRSAPRVPRTKHGPIAWPTASPGAAWPPTAFTATRTQAQRTQALAAFKAGTFRVLVGTDILARGLDVESISHVVNSDVPNLPDD